MFVSRVTPAPDAIDAEIAALESQIAAYRGAPVLPTAADLMAIALADTDFLGDITPDSHLLATNALNSADLAAEIWEETHGYPLHGIPLDLLVEVRALLVDYANEQLRDADEMRADALRDARDAGDVDADGEPIPYKPYRNA